MADGLVSVPSGGFVAKGLGMLEDSTWQTDFLTGAGFGGTFLRASGASYWTSGGALDVAASNILRLDRGPVSHLSRGALFEGARTNLILQSQSIEMSPWGLQNATVTADAATSPAGTTTADKVTWTSSSAWGGAQQSVTVTNGTAYAASAYVKAGTNSVFRLNVLDGSTDRYALFDLSSGSVSSLTAVTTAAMEPVGNGWYRCSVLFTAGGAAVTFQNRFQTGVDASYWYVWGCQLEAGSFATALITTGSATATRAADSAVVDDLAGAGLSTTGGTFVLDLTPMHGTTAVYSFPFNFHKTWTFNERIALEHTTGGNLVWRVTSGGVEQLSGFSTGIVTPGTTTRLAFAYANGRFAASRDGSAVMEQLSGSLPVGINRLSIASFNGTSNFWHGWVRRMVHYPQALPNNQLMELSRL